MREASISDILAALQDAIESDPYLTDIEPDTSWLEDFES